MALRGTLDDMGVVDLIQFPHGGRKTGELRIYGGEQEIDLFYEKGAIVHAEMGELQGVEAIVELIDWQKGDFEFHLNISTEKKTIDMELHRTVMQALKLRDERQAARARARAQDNGGEPQAEPIPYLQKQLSSFLSEHEFARYAAILKENGEVEAEAFQSKQAPEEVESLCRLLGGIWQGYPRGGLQRMLFLDEGGIVVVTVVEPERWLLSVAEKKIAMGAVSVAVGKLSAALSYENQI